MEALVTPEWQLSIVCGHKLVSLNPHLQLVHYPDFVASVARLANQQIGAAMKYALGTVILIAGAMATPTAAHQGADADCTAAATQATGYTPGSSSAEPGGRVAGAAKGAAAGAVVGGAQNNQYDNASGGLKDANQEQKAKNGAKAGVVAAGSNKRQDRRQGKQAEDAWQKSYDSCVAQKGSAPAQ